MGYPRGEGEGGHFSGSFRGLDGFSFWLGMELRGREGWMVVTLHRWNFIIITKIAFARLAVNVVDWRRYLTLVECGVV